MVVVEVRELLNEQRRGVEWDGGRRASKRDINRFQPTNQTILVW